MPQRQHAKNAGRHEGTCFPDAVACREVFSTVNIVLGLLRYVYLALLIWLTLYIVWLIKRDIERK